MDYCFVKHLRVVTAIFISTLSHHTGKHTYLSLGGSNQVIWHVPSVWCHVKVHEFDLSKMVAFSEVLHSLSA